MSERRKTLGEVIKAAVEKGVADFRVMVPARVERYDVTLGQVDAAILLKDRYEDENGDVIVEPLAPVTNVPVAFPGGGGMRITFPIAVGDTGYLLFADRSLDVWLSTGGMVDPQDDRMHHASDAIFVPGLRPFHDPWNADASVVTLGSDAGAADFVALAARVATELNAIRTALISHTHPVATTGTAVAQTGLASATTPALLVGSAGSVASTTVKIKG